MKNGIIAILCLVSLSACGTVSHVYKSEKNFILSEEGGNRGRPIAVISERLNKEGELRSELKTPFLPGVAVGGNIEEDAGGFTLYITEVHLFSNWTNGWTDARYEASGIYYFERMDNSPGRYLCKEVDPFELWEITFGEIRYGDSYYRGNDGVGKVRNRINRIRELSRLLRETGNFSNLYGDLNKTTSYSLPFGEQIEHYLFPETGDFTQMEKDYKLTEGYYQFMETLSEDDENKGKKTRGAGFLWRMDYTRSVLPEEFYNLRDTGTLWRDYEEAPRIFLSLYNLESFFKEMLADQAYKNYNTLSGDTE